MLLATTWVTAAPIDEATALQSAKSFMVSHKMKQVGEPVLAARGKHSLPAKSKGMTTNKPCYYVFNNGDDGGFVIVSGDDRTATILGYSDIGHFDASTIPTNMSEWLQEYARQIAYLDSIGTTSTVPESRKAPTMHAITPMLTSHWTQDEPFNNLLPVIGSYRAPVGCGATALAQVMNYYKWPKSTTAKIPGYVNATQYTNVDEIILDDIPAGQKFDWDNMLDIYHGNETEAQNSAVAVLSKCCGVAIKMDYRKTSAASSLSDMPFALINYFGYDSKVEYKSRENYVYDDWIQLIHSELEAGRPIIYAGQSSGAGHAFVVDGYDGEELFHINWGWNNGTDGYFLLSVLNPNDNSGTGASATGSGYNRYQEAIIGIQPSFSGDNPYTPPSEEEPPLHLTFTIDSITGSTVHGTYHNYNNEEKLYLLALGYYDQDGVLQTCSRINGNRLPYGYYWYYHLDVELTTPGRYKVFPISKVNGEEEWVPAPHVIEYIECVITEDGTKTLIWHPIKSLEATLSFAAPKYVGVREKVDITIKNIGEEYRGNLYFSVSNADGDYSYNTSFNLQLIPGKSTTAQASFVPTEIGNHLVSLSTDPDGKNVIASSSVYITEGSYTTNEVLTMKVSIDNSIFSVFGSKIYGNKVKGIYTVTNPTDSVWSGNLRFFIYNSQERWSTYYAVQIIDYSEVIKPGESVSFPYEYTGIYGEYYIVGMKYLRTYNEVGASSPYQLEHGYLSYLPDGTMKGAPATGDIIIGDDIVAVDFMDITEDEITSITTNSNPNTLYYFSQGTTLKSKLTQSVPNIVEGLRASAITLTDGHDFYIPLAFTAETITYSRVPALTSDGDEWETIALPFEVANVTCSGKTIDFHHSSSDTNKDFWLCSYNEYEGTEMYFGIPERMEAYVPYLVGFSSSLRGKSVKFTGKNAVLAADGKLVSSSPYFSLIGTMVSLDKKQVYTLSSDGKKFTLKSQATISPFRAYLTAKFEEGLPSSIPINLRYSLPGDVNGDGIVSIADVTLFVDYILGNKSHRFIHSNADMNGDKSLTVADVSIIVNIILGEQ